MPRLSKFVRRGLPTIALVVGLPFVLREFQEVRFAYRDVTRLDKYGRDTQDKLKELGVDPETVPSLEQVYKDYREKLAVEENEQTWTNVRGPRPWEENKEWEQVKAARKADGK